MAYMLFVLLGLLIAACRAATVGPATEAALTGGTVVIWVASNGWHSSVVVRRADLPPGLVPEAADFPDALFLGFGWGDAAYFPDPDPGLGTTLRAALRPTPAVLHLTGLRRPPRVVFLAEEIIDLTLSEDGFRELADFLDAEFKRGGAKRVASLAPGLYSFSRFYPANGEFHLFNTCNSWTARALRRGGLAVEVSGMQRAADLMRQLRRLPSSLNEVQ